MSPCRWPGLPCPNAATVMVNVTDVGPRAICPEHVAVMQRLGMHHTIEAGGVPAQPGAAIPPAATTPPADPVRRPAWLTRLTAVDMTGPLR